jgi:hypothetical protein
MTIMDTRLVAFTRAEHAALLAIAEIDALVTRLVPPALLRGDVMQVLDLLRVANLARDVIKARVGEVGNV